MQRLPPKAWIERHSLQLARGERLELEAFRQRLIAAGYAHVRKS